MCLSIAVERPELVLAQGKYRKFEWCVIRNPMGFRCGYVRVPKGHPWHGKDYDSIECAAHGGLTFAHADEPCGKGVDDGWWLGFDCAHYGDAHDPKLMDKEYLIFKDFRRERFVHSASVVRSQAYVENECRRIIRQAIAAS